MSKKRKRPSSYLVKVVHVDGASWLHILHRDTTIYEAKLEGSSTDLPSFEMDLKTIRFLRGYFGAPLGHPFRELLRPALQTEDFVDPKPKDAPLKLGPQMLEGIPVNVTGSRVMAELPKRDSLLVICSACTQYAPTHGKPFCQLKGPLASPARVGSCATYQQMPQWVPGEE